MSSPHALATFDRRPYFDKALRYGVSDEILTPQRLQTLQEEFAKGIVQIAQYFSTPHLRPALEQARHRMVNLVSLALESHSAGDLRKAAYALRDKTLQSHSKAGSDMLRQLHALPAAPYLQLTLPSAEEQRQFLDEKTAQSALVLAEYHAQLSARQQHQTLIDFALWLAAKLGVDRDEVDDIDALIRTAMLVTYIDKAEWHIPSRTGFVGLIKLAKKAKTQPDQAYQARLQTLLKAAPTALFQLAQQRMADFLADDLPAIRATGNNADTLLYGGENHAQAYFVQDDLDEDVRTYEKLVAREWDRVTQGKADDPTVLATVLLCLATGLPPKTRLLLREAKELVSAYRSHGFNNDAVTAFIDQHAPHALREDLHHVWQQELQPEAQQGLDDTDPQWPDAHQERAVEYLRKTCNAAWKGRRR